MATQKTNPYKVAKDKGEQQQDAVVNDAPVLSSALEPVAGTPRQSRAAESEKVGLNLRITKDRRAFIKSWCALHSVAMNDLFSDIIDQIKDERYNPLGN